MQIIRVDIYVDGLEQRDRRLSFLDAATKLNYNYIRTPPRTEYVDTPYLSVTKNVTAEPPLGQFKRLLNKAFLNYHASSDEPLSDADFL